MICLLDIHVERLGRVGCVDLALRRDIWITDVNLGVIVIKWHLKTRAGWDGHGGEFRQRKEGALGHQMFRNEK